MKNYTLSCKELMKLFHTGKLKQDEHVSFHITNEDTIEITDQGYKKIVKGINISDYLHVPKKTKFEEHYSPVVGTVNTEDWLKD